MIDIPLSFIIISVVSLIIGAAIGFFIGFKIGKHQLYEIMIKAKNREIWNLAHYVKTDEEETKKMKKSKATS